MYEDHWADSCPWCDLDNTIKQRMSERVHLNALDVTVEDHHDIRVLSFPKHALDRLIATVETDKLISSQQHAVRRFKQSRLAIRCRILRGC